MNVTSLPEGGAKYRIFKTTQNGGTHFGPSNAGADLVLGENTVTVTGVSFDRAVKFQFSSGDVEFNALSLNGVDSDCFAPESVVSSSSSIDDCGNFASGPNATWTHVLTAALSSDGESSRGAQSFTMNITSLPEGGASYRVVKTVANGNFNNGPSVALTLGENTKSVTSVPFDRTVKFQFSSGDIEFDVLTVNGVDAGCNSASPQVPNTDDGSCVAKVFGCTDSDAFNYDSLANTDDGGCVAKVFGCTDTCLL